MSALSHKHRVRTFHVDSEPKTPVLQARFTWGTNIAFRPGLIRTYAPAVAFLRMQTFARRASEAPQRHEARAVAARRSGFRALFLHGESAAIAQFLVLDTTRQAQLLKHLLSFVETAGSVDGLDGLLLTASVSMELAGRRSLAVTALAKLRHVPAPVRLRNVPVWNTLTQSVTFFSTAAQAAAALTGGRSVPIPSGGPATEDPQDDHDHCVNTWKAAGAIGGAILGGLAGVGLTGAALSGAGIHGGENTGGSGAGGATGALAGAQGGDILAGDVAQLLCPTAKPAAAATAGTPGTANPSDAPLGSEPVDDDTPDATEAAGPAEQDAYAQGFAAGYAAASGQDAPGSSDANSMAKGWGSGFADGFGAGSFSAPAPATTGVPADNASGQPAPDTSGSQPAPDSQGSGDPAPGGDGPDPTPPDPSASDSSGDDDDGPDATGAPRSLPGSGVGFPNPGTDGGSFVFSPTVAFGAGIARYVGEDGDGDGEGYGSYTIIGMPRANAAGNGLVDPGVLASPNGRAALDGDDDDDNVGSAVAPRTHATTPSNPFQDTDPDHNPKAAGAAQAAMRLMGAGFAQELLAAVGGTLSG